MSHNSLIKTQIPMEGYS